MDDKFMASMEQALGPEALASLMVPAPSQTPGLLVRPVGDVANHRVRTFVYQDVLEEMCFSCYHDQHELHAAVITGVLGLDPAGPFVEVTGFDDLRTVEHERLLRHLRQSAEQAWRGFANGVSARAEQVLGCFVSLPDSGGRMTLELARVMLSLFNMPYQMMFVLDPAQDILGLYHRPVGQRFAPIPFFLVQARPEATEPAEPAETPESADAQEPAPEPEVPASSGQGT